MRLKVLAKLPPEDLKSNPSCTWAMWPTLYRDENEPEDDNEHWAVSLLHRHPLRRKNPLNPGESPPDKFHCKLVNREEVLGNKPKAFPEYECDKCGKKVPKAVVEEKIERQRALKDIEPRNDRRGAVLATRRRNLTDPTKES